MDCFLSANYLRSFFTALCFGCVFLWTLSGQYLDSEEPHSNALFTSPTYRRNKAVLSPRRQHYEQLHPLQTTHAAAFSFRRRLLLEARERGSDANVGAAKLQLSTSSAADSDDGIDYATAQVRQLVLLHEAC